MVRTIVAFLCLAGAAAAQQARTVKQEPPAPGRPTTRAPGKSTAPEVSFRGGTEIAYDDNILELNRQQIDQLESGTRPEKFRIDDPEDLVYSVWAEVRVKARVLQDPLVAGLEVQPYFYQRSSIANYEAYELFVRQDFGRHQVGLEYDLDRDVYLRELEIVVPGPNLWESAHYDQHEIEAYYEHAFPQVVSLRSALGWKSKDFDSPFDFRDRDGYFLALEPSLDLGRGWKAFVRYEYADLESDAGSTDPDTSYREHEVEFGAAVELLEKRLEVSLRYRIGRQDYTTSNSPLDDPSHADREDRPQRIILAARAKIAKGWTLEVRYEWHDEDSDRPFDDPATTSEPGDSTRNVFVIGAAFSF